MICSHKRLTTPRSCETITSARPSSALTSISRLSTCACTDTSSALTGSSAYSTSGRTDNARGDSDALELPTRQLVGEPRQHLDAEADSLQPFGELGVGRRAPLEGANGFRQRASDAHAGVERAAWALEHDLVASPQLLRRLDEPVPDRLTIELDSTLLVVQQAAQHANQGRLP